MAEKEGFRKGWKNNKMRYSAFLIIFILLSISGCCNHKLELLKIELVYPIGSTLFEGNAHYYILGTNPWSGHEESYKIPAYHTTIHRDSIDPYMIVCARVCPYKKLLFNSGVELHVSPETPVRIFDVKRGIYNRYDW